MDLPCRLGSAGLLVAEGVDMPDTAVGRAICRQASVRQAFFIQGYCRSHDKDAAFTVGTHILRSALCWGRTARVASWRSS